GGSTNVAGAVVVIIREDAAHFAVLGNARSPIVLVAIQLALLPGSRECITLGSQSVVFVEFFRIELSTPILQLQLLSQFLHVLPQLLQRGVGRIGRQRLAEIVLDTGAIASGIETGKN